MKTIFNLATYADATVNRLCGLAAFKALYGSDSGFASAGRRRAWKRVRKELDERGITGDFQFQVICDLQDMVHLKLRADNAVA